MRSRAWGMLQAVHYDAIMKTPFAILFTIGLLAICYRGSALIHLDLVTVTVVNIALWAAIDSHNLQLKRCS